MAFTDVKSAASKYKQTSFGKIADPLNLNKVLGWGGGSIIDPLGITGGLFGSTKKPSVTELASYYYGNVGRLRAKAADEGLTGFKGARQKAKFLEKATRSEDKLVKIAAKQDQKYGERTPVKTFAELEARRADYENRLANPAASRTGQRIVRSI